MSTRTSLFFKKMPEKTLVKVDYTPKKEKKNPSKICIQYFQDCIDNRESPKTLKGTLEEIQSPLNQSPNSWPCPCRLGLRVLGQGLKIHKSMTTSCQPRSISEINTSSVQGSACYLLFNQQPAYFNINIHTYTESVDSFRFNCFCENKWFSV